MLFSISQEKLIQNFKGFKVKVLKSVLPPSLVSYVVEEFIKIENTATFQTEL